ncbi:MAG: 2-oxo acid dehydrogenase subunit E2, partial [Mesorhizobium sp.]
MPVEIILPKVDMDMATGKISRWFVEEGATVKQGDVLFEIETDKAAMEIDAPASGILRDVTGKEGVDIPVGSPVAWIYAEGEKAGAAGGRQAARSENEPRGGPASPASLPATRVDLPEQVGDRPAASDTHQAESGNGAVRATPLARRIARENGLDLAAVSGSGPHGRVVKADVEAAIAGGGAKATPAGKAEAPAPAAAPAVPKALPDDAVLKLFEQGSYELVPHDNMRKTIAKRLVEAKSTIPHFYLTLDCELDALLALRSQLNAAAPTKKTEKGEVPAYKLSVNDMIIKAMAMALMAVPDANASWTDAAMVKHKHAD